MNALVPQQIMGLTHEELSLYPFKSLSWVPYVEKFGFEVPKAFTDRTMGKSVCNDCKQVYSGHQDRCTRLRWGYKSKSWHCISWGHKQVGDYYNGSDTIAESKQYPCGGYVSWDHAQPFQAQVQLFDTLNFMIETFETQVSPSGFHLSLDQREKLALHAQISQQAGQIAQLQQVLKEIAQRMSAGGSCFIGVSF